MLTLEVGERLAANTRTCSSASETASIVQRAKQDRVVREHLLKWEKTASECDRC
ncbi:hypothetical protein [Microcoleus sp. Pol12A5]|uniref:hypothetical protein n=1 Tax=Microcoleus sp. Pol12A5 TaxID=3055392 RepID=UPI002FD668A8